MSKLNQELPNNFVVLYIKTELVKTIEFDTVVDN